MKNRTLFSTIGLLAVTALTALFILQGNLHQVEATAAIPPLAEQTAVEHAIQMAHSIGLQDVAAPRIAAKQMSLADYDKLSDFQPGPGAYSVGLDPLKQVWVVTIKGSVDWAGYGRVGNEEDKFDNITIVLYAQTGQQIATLAARPGQPLPLDVP